MVENLPSFDQVKDKAKQTRNIPVIKHLYPYQSPENAIVALDNIIDNGKVRVSFCTMLIDPLTGSFKILVLL